jgi:hypothetical protein
MACVALLFCAGTAAAFIQRSSAHGRDRVVIFGDSLTYQAEPYFNLLVQAGGRAVVSDYAFGGTAVCDWLPEMRSVANSQRPKVAVIEFTGNTFTSCMQGCLPESSAAVSRYCSDLSAAIEAFIAVGTHVFLEGTPIDYKQWKSHDPRWNDLNLSIAALAEKYPGKVTYVDAGRAVEGPGQSFVWTLPCLYFEPCTGPRIGGVRTNIVRSPDGTHFCLDQSGNAVGRVDRCSSYSSGAFRFAAAMAGPVIAWLHL